jgi:hypothetical protein
MGEVGTRPPRVGWSSKSRTGAGDRVLPVIPLGYRKIVSFNIHPAGFGGEWIESGLGRPGLATLPQSGSYSTCLTQVTSDAQNILFSTSAHEQPAGASEIHQVQFLKSKFLTGDHPLVLTSKYIFCSLRATIKLLSVHVNQVTITDCPTPSTKVSQSVFLQRVRAKQTRADEKMARLGEKLMLIG